MDQAPLDLQKHLRQLFRNVLPIFIAIGAILIVVFVVIMPGKRAEEWEPRRERQRVAGLLSAGAEAPLDPAFALVSPVEQARSPIASRFDWPMGSAHGALTYNAQPFLTTRHLGDDLNGIGGWDSDRGDAVYAVADGEVIYAGWPADGWGNVIVVLHRLPDGRSIESFYAHLETIRAAVGTEVRRGQKIGTVGKGDGRYLAHLHFELRGQGTLSAGRGYADSALGRISGEKFLSENRGAAPDRLNVALSASGGRLELPEIRFSTIGDGAGKAPGGDGEK